MDLTVSRIYGIASREPLWVVAGGPICMVYTTKRAAVSNGRRFARTRGVRLIVAE